MAYLDKQSKQAQKDNLLLKIAFCCVHCCLWCFEACIKYLTRFAYVFTALTGSSFCKSARWSFGLWVSEPGQLVANEMVQLVLRVVQTLLTPLACALLAYFSILGSWRSAFTASLAQQLRPLHNTTSPLGIDLEEQLDALSSWGDLAEEGGGWVTLLPPNAIAVACCVLLLSYAVTENFKAAFRAAIDTIFVARLYDKSTFFGHAGKERSKDLSAFDSVKGQSEETEMH